MPAPANPTAFPQPGDVAPDFDLEAGGGGRARLADYKGKAVVLYFYPKDDTSGCTAQACGFRDMQADYDAAGIRVIGVSPDPLESHVKFRDKYDLPFTLLSDPEHEAAEAYGVWKEKSMYGKKYMGIERSAFLIDEKGKVAQAWYKISPKDTPAKLLEALGA